MFRVLIAVLMLGGAVSSAQSKLTYRSDVRPILEKHCVGCHRPGQIAPMSFLTYVTTQPWAQQIKAVVSAKKMPPAVANPHYALFTNDDALTTQEIEIIVKWVDGGAVEGSAPPSKKTAPVRSK
jgi:mono/diheme cytochrome c family protein